MDNSLLETVCLYKAPYINAPIGLEVHGISFERSGEYGYCDSIQAVQEAGFLQVPPYALTRGRIIGSKRNAVWCERYDTLAERISTNIPTNRYENLNENHYIVILVGAGYYASRPTVAREIIEKKQLQHNSFPVTHEIQDMLFGEKHAYRWNGTILETVPIEVFYSYETFREASTSKEFKQRLKEMTSVYAVVRPRSEIDIKFRGEQSMEVHQENPEFIIPAGGKEPLMEMIARACPIFGKEYSVMKWLGDHDQFSDTMWSIALNTWINEGGGLHAHCRMPYFGAFVGVHPEALKIIRSYF